MSATEFERHDCGLCGTWVCDVCGWRRNGANRFGQQDCPKSPLHHGGHWEAVRHTHPGKAQDHDEAAVEMRQWLEQERVQKEEASA